MPSGEEIQSRPAVVRRAVGRVLRLREAEAQTFLNQLFECYGSDRRELGRSSSSTSHHRRLHGPPLARRRAHRDEGPDRRRGDRAEPGRALLACFVGPCQQSPGGPVDRDLQLPRRRDLGVRALPDAPVARFALEELQTVTTPWPSSLARPSAVLHRALPRADQRRPPGSSRRVFTSLVDRSAAPNELQRFILQSVWCMFAEDLTMLDGHPFQATLNEIRDQPDRSAAELGHLFRVLNQKASTTGSAGLPGSSTSTATCSPSRPRWV